jgi:orotate phosphoribosyltransferase
MDFTPMSEEEIRKALQEKGCLYSPDQGYHFVGISGKHLNGYCNIDPALPDAALLSRLTRQLVEDFKDDEVETVLVPAIGAIPLAAWGPHPLMELTGKSVMGVWADKVKPRGFIIERRGFAEAIAGKRVLIIEDMINQMFSVGELCRIIKELGGTIVGVGALVANSTATAEKIGAPKLVKLCEFAYEAWEPDDCNLCRQKVPIVTNPALGHGEEFQAEHPDYPGGFNPLESEK